MPNTAEVEQLVPACPGCGRQSWFIEADSAPMILEAKKGGKWLLQLSPPLMLEQWLAHCQRCGWMP